MLLFGAVRGRSASNDNVYNHLSVYSEVLSRIHNEYVEEPNIPKVTDGALHGLLESLDPESSYLTPRDHRIGVALAGTVPANTRCVWSFVDGDGSAREVNAACEEEIKLRVRYGRPTRARVAGSLTIKPTGTRARASRHLSVGRAPRWWSAPTTGAT